MKKLLLIVISVCLIPNNYGGWRELQQQEANQIAAADLGQKKKAQYVTSSAGSAGSADAGGSGSGSCSNDCSQCTSGDGSDASATTAMPAIAAVIQDSQGNLLTSQTFQNANFKYNNGLLSVHIFPPSNGVTASADPTYYIVYTFKSLNGNTLRKYVQGPTSTTTTGTSSLSFNSFPASVSVYLASDLGTDTNGNTLLPPNISPLASSTFLPSSTKPKVQQQLFNLMCPQSQDFLISQSGSSSATATSISGVFENSKGTITLSSGSGGGGGGNQQISVQINNQSTNTLIFPAKSFSSSDFAMGLSLTINIFPPSTATSGSYFVVGTLKTLDGLKLRKQILSNPSFNNPPLSSVTISCGSATLNSSFFNSNSTSTSAFNMICPITLKYLVQTQGTTTNVLML